MALRQGQIIARYRLIEKIGEGGMGVVWKAHDTELDRELAMKFLPVEFFHDRERLVRFEREAKALASLDHPNIVTVHSIETVGKLRFITMQLVRGSPLPEIIPAGGVSAGDFTSISRQIAAALASAHERGIVHRDIKPQNIILANDGRVRVLDFGLAKLQRELHEASSTRAPTRSLVLTKEHTLLGTVPYMSPEQVRGQPVGSPSDVFSFGVVMYELATGKRPFQGVDVADIIAAIIRDPPTPIHIDNTLYPASIGSLVALCLEKEPSCRPHAREVQIALEAAGAPLPELVSITGRRRELPPSIAVLPFTDLSPGRDQGYLCEGVAEEITGSLMRAEGLRVASRRFSFRAAEQYSSSQDLGQCLHVEHLLEGSIRKHGSRIRFSVQLTNCSTGYHIWSEQYDRDLTDLFSVQEEVARSVSEILSVVLRKRGGSEVETRDREWEAHEWYLKGRRSFRQYTKTDFELAREAFRRATSIDPGFARAYAGIAECCCCLYHLYFQESEGIVREAESASDRALALDPSLGEGHIARGLVATLRKDYERARRHYESAMRLNPGLSDAYYHYGRTFIASGDLQRAIPWLERASVADSDNCEALYLLAWCQLHCGMETEARHTAGVALESIRRHLGLCPEDILVRAYEADCYRILRDDQRARESSEAALREEPTEPRSMYNIACNFALLGSVERSIECLRRSIALGFTSVEWLEADPDLAALRGDDRFAELVEGLRRKKAGIPLSPDGRLSETGEGPQ